MVMFAKRCGPPPMQDYFMKLVDDTVETSVKHVRSFVHQYLAARLVEARSAIEDYGQRYAEAMLSALDTSKKGVHGPPTALVRRRSVEPGPLCMDALHHSWSTLALFW